MMKHAVRMGALAVTLIAAATGCHLNDVLKVPIPTGVSAPSQLSTQSGAEQVFFGARANFYNGMYGNAVLEWMELLTDEFQFGAYYYNVASAGVDARHTAYGGGFYDAQGYPWENMLSGRSTLLVSIGGLEANEPQASQGLVGEAFALAGYSEVFLAEGFCGGTPLSQVLPSGGVQFGMPASTDSILKVAESHFDSALAHAAGNDTVTNLASVGLARVLMDENQYAQAATAVQNVPADFVFNSELSPSYSTGVYSLNMYANAVDNPGNAYFVVADHKGGNGLNFASANDPRVALTVAYQTQDEALDGVQPSTSYLPTKLGQNLSLVPIATGIEAKLILAEVALSTGDSATWLTDLNTLRNGNTGCTDLSDSTCALGSGQVVGQTFGLYSLTDPSSDTARVSLMFRERAFWLYGTGSRLGDLRRLVRQYGRDQSVVFPAGNYPNYPTPAFAFPGITTYGTDVNLSIPTLQEISAGSFSESNPNYKGCTSPTTTP